MWTALAKIVGELFHLTFTVADVHVVLLFLVVKFCYLIAHFVSQYIMQTKFNTHTCTHTQKTQSGKL